MRFMIFDRWGNPLGDLPDAISAVRTQATDGTDTLDITALGEIGKDERIVFQDTLGQWNEYICQGSDVKRASGIPVTVAYAANSITELSRTYIEDKRNRDTTAKACLDKALEGTRWQAGTVDAGTLAQTANLAFYHCTVLEAIQSIADTYGLEVQTEIQPTDDRNRIGRRIIHMLDRRGQTNPTRRFEYGKDLPEISRTIDTGDVITRLYGWGKGIETTDANGQATGGYGRKIDFSSVNNGKKYVEDPTATQQWGIPDANGTRQPSVADIDFTDCDDPQKLLDLTKAKLKTLTTPTVSYTATVKALQQAGLGPEGTGLGDETQITDTTFTPPLRLQGRILKTEEDLLAPLADTKITLGNIRQSYTRRLSAQQQALDKLVSNSGAWNDAASGTGPYMRDLIDRINQIMNETGGYAYMKPGTGILVYDRPEDQNPTQAIQIGGGYWRIADKKKPNGEWDWRSLANGHGIYADTLYTGMLHDAANLNYWNLDTGEFSLSPRTTVGGQTVDTIAQTKADAARQAAIDAAKRAADNADLAKLNEAKQYAQQQADQALADAKKDASGKAAAAQSAAEKAAQAYVDALDEALGQKSIFDRLTNNGQTQGIYLSGGKVYVNGTYIKTGVIDAALVKAGILTDKKGLNYWDMTTGEFRLAAATTVGGQTVDTIAQTKADAALSAAKSDATTKADSALAAAKTYATNQAKSQVDTLDKELTQLEIFNRLTQNGKIQGIYMLNGLLYLDATYMRTGIITGKRSYWNLDTGQFSMNGPDGTVTVYLDGDAGRNLLSGTFQTGTSGNRVEISPSFRQYEISGTDELEGAGIQFKHATTSATHPYIAVESTTKQEGEVSALTFNGGHRAADDPGAFMRVGERKNDSNEPYGTVYASASSNYEKPERYASLTLNASKKASKVWASMTAGDPNGTVGVEANINDGYLHLGGFVGGWSGGRSSLPLIYWENCRMGPFSYQEFTATVSTPAKYGRYKALATVDHIQSDGAGLWSVTTSDNGASGWKIWVSTPPHSVVENVEANWTVMGDGTVKNLSITNRNANLFTSGTVFYFLVTLGVLIK